MQPTNFPGLRGKDAHEAIVALLDRLDRQDAEEGYSVLRSGPRIPFRRYDVSLLIAHPGGSSSTRTVITRDLSAGGLNVLTHGFVYPKSTCEIVLRRRTGGEDTILATVVSCRHVVSTFHHIGLKFDTPIFPKLYVDPKLWDEATQQAHSLANDIAGRLLWIGDAPAEPVWLEAHLQGTRVSCRSASESGLANALDEGDVDVVLCDAQDDDATLSRMIASLRQAGFEGPVIALIAADVPPAAATKGDEPEPATPPPPWQASGATAAFSRAWAKVRLHQALREVFEAHRTNRAASGRGPLHSTSAAAIAECPAALAMLAAYVQEARRLGEFLSAASGQQPQPTERLADAVQLLSNTGQRFGFAAVAEAAAEVQHAIDRHKPLAAPLRRLESLCAAMRPGAPDDQSDGHSRSAIAA